MFVFPARPLRRCSRVADRAHDRARHSHGRKVNLGNPRPPVVVVAELGRPPPRVPATSFCCAQQCSCSTLAAAIALDLMQAFCAFVLVGAPYHPTVGSRAGPALNNCARLRAANVSPDNEPSQSPVHPLFPAREQGVFHRAQRPWRPWLAVPSAVVEGVCARGEIVAVPRPKNGPCVKSTMVNLIRRF